MNNNSGFFDYFAASGDFPVTITVLFMVVVVIFLILMLYIPVLTRKIFPRFGYIHYSDYLPFKKVKDDNSLQISDGSLIRVYHFEGVQTSMQQDDVRESFLKNRASLFNQIHDPNVILRFFTIRDAVEEDVDYNFHQSTLQKIYEKWKNQGLKIFSNNYYLVISVKGIDAEDKLNQCCNYIESMLAAYKPTMLKNENVNNMARFFGRILSPITKPEPKVCENGFVDLVTVDEVEFLNNGFIKYESGGVEKYSAAISFKMAPDYLDEEFFIGISSIQTEMICMNGFHIMGVSDVATAIRQTQSTVDEKSEYSTMEQLDEAESVMDENVSENQTLVNYYPMFMIFGNSVEELEKYISEFKKISASYGVSPVVETFASKVSYFSMIPGFDVFPRSFKLLSKTAAISIPMDFVPRGHANCDWGKGPLVVFPTAQGTPYQFQFHVSDAPVAVGHSLTIGPSGGGKTTLYSFLIAQALRHQKLKAFFFDRNKGAEVFTLAAGGKYITMQSRENNKDINKSFETHLNPFKMEDTKANRDFLKIWLSIISGQTDPLSTEEIARAVSINFDYLQIKDRKLTNLYESCFSSGGKMREELKKWVNEEEFGYMFNEDEDSLDLQSRLTTFDFTDVLDNKTLAPAVISYILHRINNTIVSGGNPSLIMIDETAPMLENEMFCKNFVKGLQEGRKNRQAYMAAFQRANVLDKLGIGDAVRGQAQTIIFFRNPAADISDYKYWNLNPLELAFIQGRAYPNLKRAVLLSRPVNKESVILNTELGGLGSLLKLFESGRPSVLLAEELYKSYGTSFVEEYLKKNV